jgi:hypothetical protein
VVSIGRDTGRAAQPAASKIAASTDTRTVPRKYFPTPELGKNFSPT